jgi:hypothetical protein
VTRHAKRVDENHAEIRDGLRKLGHDVFDFSHVGGGVGDLAVKVSATMSIWLEVKKNKKEKLTDKEVIFKMLWFDVYHVVTSIEEAVAAINFQKLRSTF